jgi:hypothetical protein
MRLSDFMLVIGLVFVGFGCHPQGGNGDGNERAFTAVDTKLALDTADQAQTIWYQALQGGSDINSARAAAQANIRKLPGVSAVFLTADGQNIQIDFQSGLHHLLVFSDEETNGPANTALPKGSRIEIKSHRSVQAIKSVSASLSKEPTIDNESVLLWSPFEKPGTSLSLSDVEDLLKNSVCPKFSIAESFNGVANVESVKTFRDYGTVVILSHGAILTIEDSEGGPKYLSVFATGEVATSGNMKEYSKDLELHRLVSMSVLSKSFKNYIPDLIVPKYLAIASPFVKEYVKVIPGSTVFVSTCDSFMFTDLQEAFTEVAGAASFLGFDNLVSVKFASSSVARYFNQLLKGNAGSQQGTFDAWAMLSPKSDIYDNSGDQPANLKFASSKVQQSQTNAKYKTRTQLQVTPSKLDFTYAGGQLASGVHAVHIENQGCGAQVSLTPKDPWVVSDSVISVPSGSSMDVPITASVDSAPFGATCRISSSLKVSVEGVDDFTPQDVQVNLSRDAISLSQTAFETVQDPTRPYAGSVFLGGGGCGGSTPYIESSAPWLKADLYTDPQIGGLQYINFSVDWNLVPGGGRGLNDQLGQIKVRTQKDSIEPPQVISISLIAVFQVESDKLALTGTLTGGGVFASQNIVILNTDQSLKLPSTYSLGTSVPWITFSYDAHLVSPLEHIAIGIGVDASVLRGHRSGDVLSGKIVVQGEVDGISQGSKEIEVTLTLTGESGYTVSTATISFDGGSGADRVFGRPIRVTNTGGSPFRLKGINGYVDGGDAPAFSQLWAFSRGGSQIVYPGEYWEFNIYFSLLPWRPGTSRAVLTVAPDDPELAPTFVPIEVTYDYLCSRTEILARAPLTVDNTIVRFGSPVTMNSGFFCPPTNAAGAKVYWDFGDGEVAILDPSEQVTHTYSAPGTYAVEVHYVSGLNIGPQGSSREAVLVLP